MGLSNLPPGVTDRMIEEHANGQEYNFPHDYLAAVNALHTLTDAMKKIGMSGDRSITDIRVALLRHGAETFRDIEQSA